MSQSDQHPTGSVMLRASIRNQWLTLLAAQCSEKAFTGVRRRNAAYDNCGATILVKQSSRRRYDFTDLSTLLMLPFYFSHSV